MFRESNYRTKEKGSLKTVGKYLLMFPAKINYKINVEWVNLLNRNIKEIFFLKCNYKHVSYMALKYTMIFLDILV